jgi:hypothetical protein
MRRNFNSADHHTLSARVIARLSAFAGRASLAAAVAIAALSLPVAPANAALGKEQGAANASLDFNKKDGAPSLYRVLGTNRGRHGGLSAHRDGERHLYTVI